MRAEILFLFLFCVSCFNEESNKSPNNVPLPNAKHDYLSVDQIESYSDSIAELNIESGKPIPFDTLEFDKVIAYDFDGFEKGGATVYNFDENYFSKFVISQQSLQVEQVNNLFKFLTANETYGEGSAFCFDPHLAFVFFKSGDVKCVVDVCLDCNFLVSSIDIPATKHKKIGIGDSEEFVYAKGFSRLGRKSIIDLAMELGLDYKDYPVNQFAD